MKIEAAIQFGTLTANMPQFADKDLEEMREIFESIWGVFQSNPKYHYFTECLEDYLKEV